MANGGAPQHALDDGQWVAIMAILTALEKRFPGITAEAHDIVVEQHALADVVRLHGKRTEPSLRAAYVDAEHHLGVITVVAPKGGKPKRKGKA